VTTEFSVTGLHGISVLREW